MTSLQHIKYVHIKAPNATANKTLTTLEHQKIVSW